MHPPTLGLVNPVAPISRPTEPREGDGTLSSMGGRYKALADWPEAVEEMQVKNCRQNYKDIDKWIGLPKRWPCLSRRPMLSEEDL